MHLGHHHQSNENDECFVLIIVKKIRCFLPLAISGTIALGVANEQNDCVPNTIHRLAIGAAFLRVK